MENHVKESINPTKHKVWLPNSKTINIEGTNFKYEVHYDQLDEKDLLMIERYANYIFHAYQEKYNLDVNADYTFRGFTYNNLADFHNARPGHETAYAGATFHHYPHKGSWSVAHNLTEMIYFTLNYYNKKYYGYPGSTFIKDVEKELKAIRLDDNQEESQKIELSSSGEEEKSTVEEKKSGQEELSPETVLPHLNNLSDNQEESNTEEKSNTTINQEEQEEPQKVELSSSGEEEKSTVEEKKKWPRGTQSRNSVATFE